MRGWRARSDRYDGAILVLAVVLVLAVAGLAVGVAASRPADQGRIAGSIKWVGGPQTLAKHLGPYGPGTVRAASITSPSKQYETTAPHSGRFSLSVPAGRYRVTARPLHDKTFWCQGPPTKSGFLTVRAHRTTSVVVTCTVL